MPNDEDPRQWRPSWAILGIAGIVIATVFAVVASLASKPVNHVQPVPDLPGPVVGDSSSAEAPVRPPPPVSASATISAPPSKPATATASRPPVASTSLAAPLPPAPAQPAQPAQPRAPVAAFTASCDGLTCAFDGRPSTDADGRIIYFAWGYGDQNGDQGQDRSTARHRYPAAGFYNVTLVVMDDDGRIGQTSKRLTVTG